MVKRKYFFCVALISDGRVNLEQMVSGFFTYRSFFLNSEEALNKIIKSVSEKTGISIDNLMVISFNLI